MQQVTAALSMSKPVTSVEPLQQRFVAAVFERLSGQLGTKMADLYAGVSPEVVQREWAGGLGGFAKTEIQRGLDACRSRVFAPTLGEFLRLCRPGLDPEIAWLEASAGLRARENGEVGDWSHPAVYRAACGMAFEIRSEAFQKCRKRWEWELGREFAGGWRDGVPPPPLKIENNARTGPPSDAIRQRMAEIAAAARASGVAAPAEGGAA